MIDIGVLKVQLMLVGHVPCLMVVFITSGFYKILFLDFWYGANKGICTLH